MAVELKKTLLIIVVIAVVAGLLAAALYVLGQNSIQFEEITNKNDRGSSELLVTETVADGLTAPWSIDFTPSGDILFTERPGRVRMIRDGTLLAEPLLELAEAESEGGTLGLAIDPNFETEMYVYIYYTAGGSTNRISRFSFVNGSLGEEKILVDNIPGSAIHNGGRLKFGPDGNLYAGTGDASNPRLSQDSDSLAGKILRLNRDGTIPVDNPRADSFVYTTGHRNVQGLTWDSNGVMYATEHGPSGHDEINRIEAGNNYGWPSVAGESERTEFSSPVIESGNSTWAPSGMTFYTAGTLPSQWHETILFAGLRSQTLWRLNTRDLELEPLYENEFGRLRDVSTSPDGHIYLLTSNRDGRGSPEESDDRIIRIRPKD